MARPTTYTEELAESLLDWMRVGKTLSSWCKANSVGVATVHQWREAQSSFADAYTHAREAQGDAAADGAVDSSLDMEIPSDHKRIIVDTRKWFASKMRPKVYGDKQQVEHSGAVETGSFDPASVIDQLVVIANTHPTMVPQIRAWAEQLMAALPRLEG